MEALLVPGQGSQKPRQLTPWLELPGARSLLGQWSDRCGLDLLFLGTQAEADTLCDTAVAQPLLTATALLAASAAAPDRLTGDVVLAGHSVGELAALAVAGVLDAADAVALAAVRGRAMAQACTLEPTGMAAVLGATPSTVAAVVSDLGLEVANLNGAGQVVVAGRNAALDALVAQPPARTKVRRLQVAGAFHTAFMATARSQFTAAARQVPVADPRCLLLSNLDGRVVRTGAEAVALLTGQVTRPVRWDLCLASLQRLGVTRLSELPPASTLAAIARRTFPHLPVIALKQPHDLLPQTAPS